MALSSTKRLLLLGIITVLMVSGVLLLILNNIIYMSIFKSHLVLTPTSDSYPMWKILPEPMLASMYLFQVLNPDEVTKGGKPRLEQVGPYVFTEQHEKTNLTWNKNETVTYKQIRTWHFLPHLSNGSLDDEVTILNSVAATLGPMIQHQVPSLLFPIINGMLKSERLFVKKPVREIIFDGYHDPVFDDLADLEKRFPWIKRYIPQDGITDKFAFFYNRNGSDYVDGVFNMHTGVGDVSTMGKVHSWNYSTQGFFPGSCGKVHGSAGEFYSPGLDRTFIDLFSNDLCRAVRLNYRQEVKVEGINSYEFVADHSFFANGTENPDNACFEPEGARLRSGVYNTSLCRFGAPVFVSQPHFYQADPYYVNHVHGLQPKEELHGTFFRIEPRSGVPTDVVARFQINVMVAPVNGLTLLEDVSTTFIPVMWFENKAGIPKKLVSKMSLLASLPDILGGIGWGEIGLVVSMVIVIGLVYISRKKRADDASPILNQSLVEESGDDNVFPDVKDQDED